MCLTLLRAVTQSACLWCMLGALQQISHSPATSQNHAAIAVKLASASRVMTEYSLQAQSPSSQGADAGAGNNL